MTFFLFCLAGLVGLLFGGTLLVQGAVSITARLGVSPLLIGVVLVGFGTSTPELLTSLNAALAGAPGIATGNVVGSNIANILLILGLTALVRPALLDRQMMVLDGGAMVLVTLTAVPMLLSGIVGRIDGAILCAALTVYLIVRLRTGGEVDDVVDLEAPSPLQRALVIFAAGLAVTLISAHLLVLGAVGFARQLDISEAMIGVTIVAIGTSLPELVTSLIAARKGQSDLAIGNILGSNIFNISGILGLTALIHPLEVPASIYGYDQWIMVAATLALMIAGLVWGRLSRLTGGVFLLAYGGGYIATLVRSL
ncbi:calcium/sodium antiporter [Sulfitobacter sp.]|uniref:calcium/sodium antiporter n=1 Tax=Sulfitobacter sp. TaxID=1903071 RepID=UPI003001D1C3